MLWKPLWDKLSSAIHMQTLSWRSWKYLKLLFSSVIVFMFGYFRKTCISRNFMSLSTLKNKVDHEELPLNFKIFCQISHKYHKCCWREIVCVQVFTKCLCTKRLVTFSMADIVTMTMCGVGVAAFLETSANKLDIACRDTQTERAANFWHLRYKMQHRWGSIYLRSLTVW